MRGHSPLVAMRRRGHVPAVVVVNFDLHWLPDWADRYPRTAFVAIEPTDNPRRLDMRFLVGLSVVVLGSWDQPVREVTAAVVKAGARKVGASIFEPGPWETVREVSRFDSGEGATWYTC